ncbi:hypothetical protein GCM10010519_24300 [Streptomyces lactacystinicus]
MADERQRVAGLAVEPVHVVDQAQQRLFRDGLGQQRQRGQADQIAVGRRPGDHAERRGERLALRIRQRVEAGQERAQQPVQGREAQLRLGLHPGRTDHPQVRRGLGQVVEQPGLADAGLADQDQRRAHAVADACQQLGQDPQFFVATGERDPAGAGADRQVSSHCPQRTTRTPGGP